MRLFVLTASCVALFGCGAPAIIDASSTIAATRGCEPVDLSVAATDAGYQVEGCGPSGVYSCTDGSCTESDGAAHEGWASEADAVLASITSEALTCNHGAPVTVQVRLDAVGEPQGMISELSGDERACVGRLVLDADFPAGGSERLISHRFGDAEPSPTQAPGSDEPAASPIPEPSPTAPSDEPSSYAEEPASSDSAMRPSAREDSATEAESLEGL